MDRVELIVKLTGDDQAIRSLQSIKNEMAALKNTKVQLQIDRAMIDRELANVRHRIRELTSGPEKIRLEVEKYRVEQQIRDVERELSELQRMRRLNLDEDQLAAVNRQIRELRDELDRLTSEKKDIQLEIKGLDVQAKELADELNELTAKRNEIQVDAKDVDNAIAGLKEAGRELDSAKTKAEQFGDALGKIGSALGSAGNVFTNISHIFDSNVIDTMERYATVMATRLFAQNWGAATERFDILSTYADYLEIVGVTAEESAASLDKINAKIQGLPVGLSDVAYQTRMYQMYLNDMERATNLAIGLNRALIAGGANEQMRNTAKYEIDRLLATGTLNTSRQWRALIQGLGVSGRFLREEMGYGNLTQNQFVDQLFKKEISGDEFIRGIERLADSGKLNAALDIYKTTIESGLSNIYFALTRGKANILAALDESLMEGTGKNISGWLYEIRDGINEVYKAAASWISENPEMLNAGIERILAIFERLAAFDWAGLVTKIGTGVGQYLDILMRLYDAINAISPDAFEDFITFAMVWAGPIGTSLRLLAGACNVLSGALHHLGPAMKWLKEFALLNPAIVQNVGLYGGAMAAFGLMMAGYAKEAKNAEYALRDYKAALDEANAVGGFENKLSMFAEAGDIEGMEEQLEALKQYESEQRRILSDMMDYRDELETNGQIDFSVDEMTGKLSDEAAAVAELNAQIQWNTEEAEGAASAYDTWIAALDKLKKAKEQAAMAEAFPDGPPEIPEAQLQQLTNLVTKWTELREETQKTIDKQLEGFAKIEQASTVGIGTLTENLQSQVDALTNFSTNLAEIDKAAANLGGAQGEALAQIAGTIAGMGLEGAGIAQGLNDALQTAFETQDWTAVSKLIEVWQSKLDAEDAAVDMTAFAQTFATNFTEALNVAFDNLEGFGSVAELMLTGGGEISEEAIQAEAEKLATAYQAVQEKAAEIVGNEEDDASLSAGLSKSQDLINEIVDTSLPALDEAVGTFAETNETELTAAVTNVRTATLEAIAEVIRQFDNLMLKITAVRLRAESEFPTVVTAIESITRAVEELIAKLQELTGQTWTVNVEMNESGGGEGEGGGEGGSDGGAATGGYIDGSGKPKYYAKGGWVFMRPRGTDTVPTMLTPGEYVLRRGAVDQLGVPFLQRLNRLDIAGALDNLMHRFYRPSQAAYSVVNNSADNRAYNVNVYNYQSTEDYTYRVAARFAHAL